MTNGGMTFRRQIDINKSKILDYLSNNGLSGTSTICRKYGGEKEMSSVRKALNELRKEGKITTDDHVHFWEGKKWQLVKNTNN